ncbi:hypothetical protein, partial [Mycolicibacterium insubricum]|uniref:hypothetical protein n=1 Tax=Mycolicibacterium insubricum TaxID=444597 RepID=UPI0021F2A854
PPASPDGEIPACGRAEGRRLRRRHMMNYVVVQQFLFTQVIRSGFALSDWTPAYGLKRIC